MKKSLVVLIILAILIGGGGYYAVSKRSARVKGNSQTVAQREQNFYTIRNGSIMKTISANGNLLPVNEKDIQFATNGRVKEVKVKPGERVEAGQLLATLENTSEELSLLKAKNNYELALINNAKSVQAERKLEYQIAEKNFKEMSLYAPFAGLLTSLDVAPEEQVSASKVVGHLIDDSSYTISVYIDEVDMSQIQLGQQARVILEAFPGMELRGEVVSVGFMAENQGGVVVVPVEIAVAQVDPQVKSGLSATVEIVIGQARNVPVVPVTALIQQQDGMYAMKKVGDKIEAVKVVTGISNDLLVSITEGLAEGDQIVVNNFSVIEQIRNASQRSGFGQGSMMMNPMQQQRTTTGARR